MLLSADCSGGRTFTTGHADRTRQRAKGYASRRPGAPEPDAAARHDRGLIRVSSCVGRTVSATRSFRCRGSDQALNSRELILYVKVSGSRPSLRPSAVSACGYMKKATAPSPEPGSV